MKKDIDINDNKDWLSVAVIDDTIVAVNQHGNGFKIENYGDSDREVKTVLHGSDAENKDNENE